MVTGGRERRIQQGGERYRNHVLLPEGVVPPVYHRVVRLARASDRQQNMENTNEGDQKNEIRRAGGGRGRWSGGRGAAKVWGGWRATP